MSKVDRKSIDKLARRVAADQGHPATDTISVPLTAEDFGLIERALGAWSSDYNDAPHDHIAELRDRLKRARLLP